MKPGFLLALLLACPPSTVAATAFPFFQPLQPPRRTQVMAHRGASTRAPENTRAALALCIEDGIEWAEVDVRLTSDGQHILAHDAKITTNGPDGLVVKEHTLAELLAVDAGSAFAQRFSGVHPLSLAECLQMCRGKLNLYLDCKAIDPQRLVKDILDAGMQNQVVVYDQLGSLRQVTEVSEGRVPTMAKWRPGLEITSWARTNRLAAAEVNADEITPEVVTAFHAVGLKVETKNLDQWDRPEFHERVLAAGADWVQTDRPEEVLARALWRGLVKRPVRISNHRGASRYAPENTLPAFEKAIALGVDFVEFDVRTTSDGGLFLLHDARLDRTTTASGPIATNSSAVVASLSAGVKFGRPFANVRVPTLDDFLGAMAGKVEFYFDAKAITPEELARAVEQHGLAEQTVVYQHPEFLARLKQINPRIRALPPLGDARELPGLVARLKPYAVDASWKILSQDLIDQCHQAGVLVFSDALGQHETIADYQRAMDWGIDLIQTDHPLRLLRAIELRTTAK